MGMFSIAGLDPFVFTDRFSGPFHIPGDFLSIPCFKLFQVHADEQFGVEDMTDMLRDEGRVTPVIQTFMSELHMSIQKKRKKTLQTSGKPS